MSWSNVPDYIEPGAFHEVARALSRPGGEDTVHFMHSMNWVQVRLFFAWSQIRSRCEVWV